MCREEKKWVINVAYEWKKITKKCCFRFRCGTAIDESVLDFRIRMRVRMIGAAVVMILMFGLTIALVKIDSSECKHNILLRSIFIQDLRFLLYTL